MKEVIQFLNENKIGYFATLDPTFRNFGGLDFVIFDLPNPFKNRKLPYSPLHRVRAVCGTLNAFFGQVLARVGETSLRYLDVVTVPRMPG